MFTLKKKKLFIKDSWLFFSPYNLLYLFEMEITSISETSFLSWLPQMYKPIG